MALKYLQCSKTSHMSQRVIPALSSCPLSAAHFKSYRSYLTFKRLTETVFCPQRTGTRRRYQDDGISDDEIEGKRMFDLDEKLQCVRFNSDLIKHMEGKGERFPLVN